MNLAQGVDLVLLADRADLEEGEAPVHGEHQDGAHQHEEDIRADLQLLHRPPSPVSFA